MKKQIYDCITFYNANLLFEAQLGAGRDLVYGEYPYTTSSNVTAAYAGIGSGLPALRPERVVVIPDIFFYLINAYIV